MAHKKNHLSLYLQNYAEPETQTISGLFSDETYFDHCLVIPAYNEGPEFIQRIKASKLSQQALLLIVVINQPDTQPCINNNQALYLTTQHIGSLCKKQKQGHITQWDKTTLLTLDYFSHERRLPAKQGVGLARKTGCDIACALIEKGLIKAPWIHTSDADTHLPDDYFFRTPLQANTSAAIYPFQHQHTQTEADKRIGQATQLYEQALHYYVAGLHYACSPYAYHSLGSCIAVNAHAYAKARGFPKRAGGEDFYLLNKVNKLDGITQLRGKPLLIESRLSARAPFGTGPAVSKIIEQGLTAKNYYYYNPLAFKALKLTLKHLENLFQFKHKEAEWLAQCPPPSQAALSTLGIDSLFKHTRQHANKQEEYQKKISDWFDGFRTLKFLHLLESTYKKVPLEQAILTLKTMIENE